MKYSYGITKEDLIALGLWNKYCSLVPDTEECGNEEFIFIPLCVYRILFVK